MTEATTLGGGCHCGKLRIAFSTTLDPADMTPRACDCSFCQKHGAAYVSDPAGELCIRVESADALHRYRQGSNTAEFLFCGHCGILVAVILEHDARIHGAINARCLDAAARLGEFVSASPQQLSPEGKVDRWLRLWIPDVQLAIDGMTRANTTTPRD